jgi:hypothetical protein
VASSGHHCSSHAFSLSLSGRPRLSGMGGRASTQAARGVGLRLGWIVGLVAYRVEFLIFSFVIFHRF